MKIKVAFGQSRLLMPCGNTADKVERLIEDINKRFQSHLGDPTAQAKELTTHDGFLVNPHDTIEQVIEDGCVLIALDYRSWLKANLELLEKGGYKLDRPDYAEGNWRPPYRYAEIGKHKHNKIYVKIGSTANEVDRLELFDLESLKTFGDEGRALIAHKEVKEKNWDWSVQVHFIVEKGVVVAAELSVRTTSDPRPQIELVPINADLTLGEAVVKQTASLPKPDKTYALPETKSEGPSIKDFVSADQEPSGIVNVHVPENNVATGNIELDIKQKDATQPDQSWASDGAYMNLFYNHLSIFNPQEEKEVAVVKYKSEYEKDGQWVEMRTRLGSKSGYYRYSFGYYEDGFVLGPNERLNLAIESGVEVKAPQYDRARRAHHSLPSPLRIRVTFEDKDGKTAQIVLEHTNLPLYLTTQESREKAQDRKSDFWLSVDDTEAEARAWIEAVHVPDSQRVEIASKPTDKSLYMYKNTLDYYAYLAKKEGKSEIPVEDLTTEDDKKSLAQKVTVLVDLEKSWVYALRFELKSSTSSTVGHYLLPDLS